MACAKSSFSAMSGCDQTNGLFLDVKEYYEDLAENPNADEIIRENYEKNKVTIQRDKAFVTREWNYGVYFNSGFFVGESQGLYEGYPTFD